jgi:hypothetical protein
VKILGTEKQKYANCLFSVNVVDSLDSSYTTLVKKSFFGSADYKKRTFTNGTLEKVFVENANAYCKVKFKVIEGDYLVIMDEHDNITIYITEQYVGLVQVKNKTVQTVIDEYYSTMRGRIDSKREFAREMGSISRRINIPFHIVMAFKGNEELLMQLVRNIEDAISKRRYEDKSFMAALCGNNFASRMKAIETMGITNIPEYQSEKIAKYLHECLEKRKIIRRFE